MSLQRKDDCKRQLCFPLLFRALFKQSFLWQTVFLHLQAFSHFFIAHMFVNRLLKKMNNKLAGFLEALERPHQETHFPLGIFIFTLDLVIFASHTYFYFSLLQSSWTSDLLIRFGRLLFPRCHFCTLILPSPRVVFRSLLCTLTA